MTPNPHFTRVTETLRQAYAAARRYQGESTVIVVLHLGAEQSGIALGQGPEPALVNLLPLGVQSLAQTQFKTSPATPLAMENAIQLVEDEVMPLRAVIPPEALLFSTDASVREIALLADVAADDSMQLSLDAMERVFNRLGAVLQGSPAAHQGLPESNDFAAALLILREFMHHLQFARIVVLHA